MNQLFKNCLYAGLLFLLISGPTEIYGQSIKRQSISSYGSAHVLDNLYIGVTVGQSYSTYSANGEATQGFQQPNIISVKPVQNPVYDRLDVLIYPNPASHSIVISSEKEIQQSLIRVTDVNGRAFYTEKVSGLVSHTLECTSWTNGVYFITVQDAHQNSKTFRLIISK